MILDDALIDRSVQHFKTTQMHDFIDNVRTGWSNYSFIFYIGAVAAILGNYLGLAGTAALPVGVGVFYYLGKFHKRLSE